MSEFLGPLEQGFIISSDWLDIGGKHYLRYMGTGSMGSFELVVTGFKPYFFVGSDCVLPAGVTGTQRSKTNLQNYASLGVDKLSFQTYQQQLQARRLLEQKGYQTFEADIRPTDRYLMDRGIYGSFSISACKSRLWKDGLIRYLDPELVPSDFDPVFKVVSLDIETAKTGEVLSVGFHSWQMESDKESQIVLMLGEPSDSSCSFNRAIKIHSCQSERQLLLDFDQTLQTLNPDVIIGWNVVEFDLSHLIERCKKHRLASNWGKMASPVVLTPGSTLGKRVHMNGRVVIDGPNTLRLAFYTFENFKLETVAQKLLKKGKAIVAEDSWEEIERRFREDKPALAHYNMQDCLLVSEIFKKCDLLTLQMTRSKISGLLMNRVGLSTAAFDHFFVPASHTQGLVAGNVKDTVRARHAAGGHVLSPKVGLYEHVVLLDFKSLYPSILNTFKIDPVSRFRADSSSIKTPTGHYFSGDRHCLPKYIENLLAKRKQAKAQNNSSLSQAIKILMNSFYGVMGSGACRFYHPDLPEAITGTGRWILRESEKYFESRGYQVVYGDTDSVFVVLKSTETDSPQKAGAKLAKQLNQYFFDRLQKEFLVRSELEVEFEKYYLQFFLPPSRSKVGGSKKRYAGLLFGPQAPQIEFTGLEFVRSDWTQLAKEFQFGLMEHVFTKRPPQSWIKQFVSELTAGKRNRELIYSRRLVKPLKDYTKTRPPHVKAAALLPPGKLKALGRKPRIEYLMTLRGPIPTTMNPTDIDFEHYIEKQIQPIADTVLWMYGEQFSELFQNKLFPNTQQKLLF